MPRRSFWTRPPVLLGLALCALALAITLIGKLTGGSDSGKAKVLSSGQTSESYPSFSPDGKRLAYSMRASKGDKFHIYVRAIPGSEGTRLTAADASDVSPAWSPDGRSIAFVRIEADSAACMTIPAAGGAERKLADCSPGPDRNSPLTAVAWTPDGGSIVFSAAEANRPAALNAIPAAGGAAKRITDPPEGSPGDFCPAVASDGKTLAFVRMASPEGGDVWAGDLSGGSVRRLTFDDRPVRGLAWLADGSTLIYASNRANGQRLSKLPAAGGSPTVITVSPQGAQFPALAPTAKRLVFARSDTSVSLWRSAVAAGGEGAPLIRSAGRESAPSYSPDGKRIANISDRTGADEIWVGDAEGNQRTQISQLKGRLRPGGLRWSPDGTTLLFEARGSGTPEIDSIPASGGAARRVVSGASNASWSRDGKSIYYFIREKLWKAGADGGSPREIPIQGYGGAQPEESTDGKYVYYRKWRGIWRVPLGGGAEEIVVEPERGTIIGGPRVTEKGFYFIEMSDRRRGSGLEFYDFASKKTTVLFANERIVPLTVSPDGKYVLHTRMDNDNTTLMLVENFR
jgi:Tol biopolymer transport system component